jgi:Flp pilus assembly pilin Flp
MLSLVVISFCSRLLPLRRKRHMRISLFSSARKENGATTVERVLFIAFIAVAVTTLVLAVRDFQGFSNPVKSTDTTSAVDS